MEKLKEKISDIYDKIETFYYNIKWTIVNFYKYSKIVSNQRPWDYQYILEMMKFQLQQLCDNIEKNGIEIDETRLPKIAKMKRVIEILNSQIEDDYADRCGYIAEANKIYIDEETGVLKWELQPGYENYNENKVFDDANILRNKEWDELFEILKQDMRGWWD